MSQQLSSRLTKPNSEPVAQVLLPPAPWMVPAPRLSRLPGSPTHRSPQHTTAFTASGAKKTQTTRPCWRTSLTLLSFRPPLDRNRLWFSQTWRRSYGWRFWASPGGRAPPEARCRRRSPSRFRLLPVAGLWAHPPITLQEGKVCLWLSLTKLMHQVSTLNTFPKSKKWIINLNAFALNVKISQPWVD